MIQPSRVPLLALNLLSHKHYRAPSKKIDLEHPP